MPKPKPPEGYETQGQGYLQQEDRNALIGQVASEIVRDTPSAGARVSFQGDELIVRFHCVERMLDDQRRLEGVRAESEKHVRDFMKELKSEYRKRCGKALTAKEDKERRNYTTEKVNLNGSYHFVYQQVYSLS